MRQFSLLDQWSYGEFIGCCCSAPSAAVRQVSGTAHVRDLYICEIQLEVPFWKCNGSRRARREPPRWRGPISRASPLRSHPGHGFNAKQTRLNRRSRGCAITVARYSPRHSMKAPHKEIFEERRVNCVLKFKNNIKRLFDLLLLLPLWIISKCGKFSCKLL